MQIFVLSAKTGEGIPEFMKFLEARRQQAKSITPAAERDTVSSSFYDWTNATKWKGNFGR
jgi:hypothetical protein